MGIDQIREQIRRAFPPSVFEGAVTDCNCEECTDIGHALNGKRWDEVPDSFVDFTCSPVLLTPEAFAAFLPAYMLRALNDLEARTVVLELTTYSLSPYDSDDECVSEQHVNVLKIRAGAITSAQMTAVGDLLRFASINAREPEPSNTVGGNFWHQPAKSAVAAKRGGLRALLACSNA